MKMKEMVCPLTSPWRAREAMNRHLACAAAAAAANYLTNITSALASQLG